VVLSWDYTPIGGSTPSPACQTQQSFTNDANATVTCDVSWTSPPEISYPYRVQVELSNPAATFTLARPPDSNGWYNHAVGVTFQGSAFSGIAFCTTPTTYSGPDAAGATVRGACTDNAGKVAATSAALNYDSTPPTITAVHPSRAPDHNGWYNHPVSFAFTGTDSTSGIAGCSTSTYSGPNSAVASVTGSCTDRAGNVATMPTSVHYDATPPPLALSASPGDQVVGLHWRSGAEPAPIASFNVVRTPGLDGHRSSVLYRGRSGALTDSRVRNGVRYRYVVTASDEAGNVTTQTLSVTPGPRLLSPSLGARLSAPPLLHWTRVRRASYYNVQLYRLGKVLSTWPAGTRLQLALRWSFEGKHYRLTPGRYRWYVWPGFGRRSTARYGPLVGSGTFTITTSPAR
jgi:hypothetical protein